MSDSSDVKGGIGSGHIIAALIAAAAASFAVYQVWRKYTAPPPVPQATTQAIADLKQRFGDDTRVEVSPLDLNMVKIEDALTVAPGRVRFSGSGSASHVDQWVERPQHTRQHHQGFRKIRKRTLAVGTDL